MSGDEAFISRLTVLPEVCATHAAARRPNEIASVAAKLNAGGCQDEGAGDDSLNSERLMELVNVLMQQLGINSQQASGGLGLLMGAAKEKLGGDFNQVAQTMPGIDGLIQQAPQPEGGAAASGSGVGGALGALSGMLGGKAGGALGSLGTLASLAGGFKQLGLSSDSIGRFIPVILSFVQNKGGDTAKNLLAGVLK